MVGLSPNACLLNSCPSAQWTHWINAEQPGWMSVWIPLLPNHHAIICHYSSIPVFHTSQYSAPFSLQPPQHLSWQWCPSYSWQVWAVLTAGFDACWSQQGVRDIDKSVRPNSQHHIWCCCGWAIWRAGDLIAVCTEVTLVIYLLDFSRLA